MYDSIPISHIMFGDASGRSLTYKLGASYKDRTLQVNT